MFNTNQACGCCPYQEQYGVVRDCKDCNGSIDKDYINETLKSMKKDNDEKEA